MTEAQAILRCARYISYGVLGIVSGWAVFQLVLFFSTKRP